MEGELNGRTCGEKARKLLVKHRAENVESKEVQWDVEHGLKQETLEVTISWQQPI